MGCKNSIVFLFPLYMTLYSTVADNKERELLSYRNGIEKSPAIKQITAKLGL